MATTAAGTLITRNYSSFRGVDFSNRKDEISIYRSPDALNMWKNYKNDGGRCIETRPALEFLSEYPDRIYGLFFYNGNKIVHSGTKLYKNSEEIYSGMIEHKSNFFVFNNLLYIKDGNKYLVYDGTTVKEVEGYVPRTSISRSPSGGGQIYEDVNLLTGIRKNSFCADGEATEYFLDAQNIDLDYQVKITINDEEVTNFTVDYETGKITFTTAPTEPLTTGQDNVFIEFRKTIAGYRERIEKCTLVEVFDNRVFFSGNSDYPNILWHCSLEDPTYCSDLDYYTEGEDDSSVKSIVAGNNALWVMKEPSQSNTTIFYHNPTIDADYGKIYPSVHSSISTGCVSSGINFQDSICFFSDRGLESVSGDVTTEQALIHRSTLIDNRLLTNSEYKSLIVEEWEGYLLVFLGSKVFLADSRTLATVNDHNEFEWFYWDLGKKITSICVKDGVLYLCVEETIKENGVNVTKYVIYTLTNLNDTREVEAYWTTLQDEFTYPQYQKTTNKKGCVVDMEGAEISIYAKTDNNSFDLINTYKNVKGYIVPRIKEKKWKSIQLKFSSNTPFHLYSGTLEAFVGAYVKR